MMERDSVEWAVWSVMSVNPEVKAVLLRQLKAEWQEQTEKDEECAHTFNAAHTNSKMLELCTYCGLDYGEYLASL